MSSSGSASITLTKQTIARLCPQWQLFLDSRRASHVTPRHDNDPAVYDRVWNAFRSHCSTYKKAHPDIDCSYPVRWPVYCKDVLGRDLPIAANVVEAPAIAARVDAAAGRSDALAVAAGLTCRPTAKRRRDDALRELVQQQGEHIRRLEDMVLELQRGQTASSLTPPSRAVGPEAPATSLTAALSSPQPVSSISDLPSSPTSPVASAPPSVPVPTTYTAGLEREPVPAARECEPTTRAGIGRSLDMVAAAAEVSSAVGPFFSSSSSSRSPSSSPSKHRRFHDCIFTNPTPPHTQWQLSYHREGTYSEVYIGRPVPRFAASPHVAVKVGKADGAGGADAAAIRDMLLAEAKKLHILQATDAVCRLYHRPKENDKAVDYMGPDGRVVGQQPVCIIMTLLQCDFSELRKGGHLTRVAMWEGFLLMFRALCAVHQGGVLHRDVKPSNFALAFDNAAAANASTALHVFAVDFGQSAYVFQGDTRIPNCPTSFKGRSYWASVARHRGHSQGRSDDIIMLLYVFLDFLWGALPWKELDEHRSWPESRRRAEVLQAKVTFRAEGITKARTGAGERELVDVLRCMEEVRAEDEPPYEMVEAALRKGRDAESGKGEKGLQQCVSDFLRCR
jgi:hypothetical protein